MNLSRKIAAVVAGAVFAVVAAGVATPASADTSWGYKVDKPHPQKP